MKPVFVFRLSEAKQFLEEAFNWSPPNLVDASELARRDNIRPSMADMANSLVGGEFCRRAIHFTDAAWPSATAVHHLDIAASVIYDYCMKGMSLHGRDWRDAVDRTDERKRKRDESGSRSSSSSSKSRSRRD